MTRSIRTSLLLFCALTLFLQGVAAVALPCAVSSPADQADTAAHAHHGAADAVALHPDGHSQSEQLDAAKCCDGGYCSQGGCVSLLALLQVLPALEQQALNAATQAPLPSRLTRTPSTPDRPPALA